MAGAAGALIGIGALLDPIHALADALDPAEQSARKRGGPTLPEVGDIISRLFHGVRGAAVATRERIDELKIAANEDALTGIANRRGFLAQLDALPLVRRRGCLTFINLHHFMPRAGERRLRQKRVLQHRYRGTRDKYKK